MKKYWCCFVLEVIIMLTPVSGFVSPIPSKVLTGEASWYYAKRSHKSMWGTSLLAASNEFRPGLRIKVDHRGKSVVVIICGTGPFIRKRGKLIPHPTRKLDLSREAFNKLANPDTGVLKVTYQCIGAVSISKH